MPVTGGLELVTMVVGVVLLLLLLLAAAAAGISYFSRSARKDRSATKPVDALPATPEANPPQEIAVAISAAVHRYRVSHSLKRSR